MRRALLAALVVPLAGCAAQPAASGKFKGQAQQVAQVVADLSSAGRSGNAQKICTDILAKELVQQLRAAGGDCETEMQAAIQDATDYDLQVADVTVTGNRATARVRQGAHGKIATFTFVKENGGWRAMSLGGG
jgi:pheromone shutdown protein TraB